MTVHVFTRRERQDEQFDIKFFLLFRFSTIPSSCSFFSSPLFLPLHLSFSLFLLFAHSLLFPYTGSLIQVPMSEKGKITRGRLGSLSLKKEGERQCFLFSKHLIICTRGSGGKLHLTKVGLHCWTISGAAPYFKHHNLTVCDTTYGGQLFSNSHAIVVIVSGGVCHSHTKFRLP